MEKENNTDKSDFTEKEILDLNSLKPFELESKTNIGVFNSSSSGHEEEGIDYNVKQIGNSEWCECSTEPVVGQMFFKTGAVKNFTSFTGKYLCWILFLIKLQT